MSVRGWGVLVIARACGSIWLRELERVRCLLRVTPWLDGVNPRCCPTHRKYRRKESLDLETIPWLITRSMTKPIANQRRSVSKVRLILISILVFTVPRHSPSPSACGAPWETIRTPGGSRRTTLTNHHIRLSNPPPLLQHTHLISCHVSNCFYHRCRRSHRPRRREQVEARGVQSCCRV